MYMLILRGINLLTNVASDQSIMIALKATTSFKFLWEIPYKSFSVIPVLKFVKICRYIFITFSMKFSKAK